MPVEGQGSHRKGRVCTIGSLGIVVNADAPVGGFGDSFVGVAVLGILRLLVLEVLRLLVPGLLVLGILQLLVLWLLMLGLLIC